MLAAGAEAGAGKRTTGTRATRTCTRHLNSLTSGCRQALECTFSARAAPLAPHCPRCIVTAAVAPLAGGQGEAGESSGRMAPGNQREGGAGGPLCLCRRSVRTRGIPGRTDRYLRVLYRLLPAVSGMREIHRKVVTFSLIHPAVLSPQISPGWLPMNSEEYYNRFMVGAEAPLICGDAADVAICFLSSLLHIQSPA